MEEIKVMTPDNLEEVLQFEMDRLEGDPLDREITSWHAPWRREALAHYLPLGWSFLKKKDGKILGYVICQPLLFFQGWTQNLWIEHVSAVDHATGVEMLEIAYRWAKDKHLQKVFFKEQLKYSDLIDFGKKNQEGPLISMNTTKI